MIEDIRLRIIAKCFLSYKINNSNLRITEKCYTPIVESNKLIDLLSIRIDPNDGLSFKCKHE